MMLKTRTLAATDIVWLLLVVATCLSWMLGTDHLPKHFGPHVAGLAILATAMVKIRFVIRYFMEVRVAPLPLRIACDGWIAIVGVGMSIFYLAAPG